MDAQRPSRSQLLRWRCRYRRCTGRSDHRLAGPGGSLRCCPHRGLDPCTGRAERSRLSGKRGCSNGGDVLDASPGCNCRPGLKIQTPAESGAGVWIFSLFFQRLPLLFDSASFFLDSTRLIRADRPGRVASLVADDEQLSGLMLIAAGVHPTILLLCAVALGLDDEDSILGHADSCEFCQSFLNIYGQRMQSCAHRSAIGQLLTPCLRSAPPGRRNGRR